MSLLWPIQLSLLLWCFYSFGSFILLHIYTNAQSKVTDQVTDEFCPKSEYENPVVNYDKLTESFEFECWDPDKKWVIKDVYNQMGKFLNRCSEF